MLSNKHLMFSSDSNNLYVVDIDDDTIKTVYNGLKCRITSLMKCADFYDFETYMKNKSKGIDYQTVLTTGNDGYVYLYMFPGIYFDKHIYQYIDESKIICDKCKKKLLDLNSPMGWKLYMDLYGSKAKSSVDSDSHTYYA